MACQDTPSDGRTLSRINAGLAQSKNHCGLLWWVASLFFGPLATFIIVAVLDKRVISAKSSTKDLS